MLLFAFVVVFLEISQEVWVIVVWLLWLIGLLGFKNLLLNEVVRHLLESRLLEAQILLLHQMLALLKLGEVSKNQTVVHLALVIVLKVRQRWLSLLLEHGVGYVRKVLLLKLVILLLLAWNRLDWVEIS